MQKIMFNDKYGLTDAVLAGRKTQTRRLVGNFAPIVSEVRLQVNGCLQEKHGQVWFPCDRRRQPKYELGEVVAVAQSYEEICLSFIQPPDKQWGVTREMSGYRNKMYVRADLMPHQIRITNVRLERLKDISDEDCLREGILEDCPGVQYSYPTEIGYCAQYPFGTPREAFAALIDKVSGKGTWKSNPLVFVYEFELVK